MTSIKIAMGNLVIGRGISCLLLIMFFLVSPDLVAVDQITVDFARPTRFLPYDILQLGHFDFEDDRHGVGVPLMVCSDSLAPFGPKYFVHAYNPPMGSSDYSSLTYNQMNFIEISDHDPIALLLSSVMPYSDTRQNRLGILAGGYRNDSAFVARTIPGSDYFDWLYLASGTDQNGDSVWRGGVNLMKVYDYDFDGVEEAFAYVSPGRDLSPRVLFCINPEKLEIEWSLPVASIINELYPTGDSIDPGVMIRTYNVKNRVTDSIFSDLYCYIARINQRGEVVYQKIMAEEHGGVSLAKVPGKDIFFVTHSLDFLEPDDTLEFPERSYSITRFDSDGVRVRTVFPGERINHVYLADYDDDGKLDLYTLSSKKIVRIYDQDLNLVAVTEPTDFVRIVDYIAFRSHEKNTLLIENARGTGLYTTELKQVAHFDDRIDHFFPLESSEDGHLTKAMVNAHNNFYMLGFKRKETIDYARLLFWEYQNHITVGLFILAAALLVTNIMRVKTVHRLKESERKFERLFRANPAAAVYHDKNLKILDVNPKFEKLFGYTRQEIVGKKINETLFPESDEKNPVNHIPHRLSEGTVEKLRKRKNGRLIHVAISSSVIEIAGKVTGYVGLYQDITERKQAEKKLADSEEKYRLLVHNVYAGIALIDYEGVFQFINKRGSLAHNKPPEEIIGKSMWDLFPHEIADFQMENIRRVIDSNEVYTREEKTFIDGQWRWYDINIQPFRETSGTLRAALVITHDTTVRKQAEMVIRESEARFRELAELLPEGVYEINMDGILTYVNQEILNSFGYSNEDIENGISGFDFLAPECRSQAREHLQRILSGEIIKGSDYTGLKKDGTKFPIRIHSSCVYKDDKPVGLRGIVIDMSEITSTMQALRESEERFRVSFDNVATGMAQVDPEGRFLRVNNSLAEMLGYSPDEMTGRSFQSFTHPDDYTIGGCAFKKLLSGEIQTAKVEKRYLHKSGRTVHVIVNSTRINDTDGKLLYMISQIQDITQRRLAEEALRKSEMGYRSLFEDSPIILCEEDLSKVMKCVRSKLPNNVENYQEYLLDHSEDLLECISELRIVNINRAGLSSYSAKDIDNLRDFFTSELTEDNVRAFAGMIATFLSGGTTYETEFLSRTIRGDDLFVHLKASVAPGHEQTFSKVILSGMDFTEKRRTELALAESRQRLKAILNSIDDLIFVLDRRGRFKFFEQVANKNDLYQLPQEFIGRNIADVMPSQIAAKYLQCMQEISTSGGTRQFDYPLRLNGCERWYSVKLSPLRDHADRFSGITAVAREITDKITANRELQKERDLIKSILDTANSLIVCLDENARITVFNDECERITGYQREEVLGKCWPELFLPEHIKHEGLKRFARWVKDHPEDKYEGPLITRSGETRIILWSNSAIIPKDSEKITAIAIGQDITDRKKAESALRDSEQKARAQYLSIPVPTYTWKKVADDFILTDFNHAATEITRGKIKDVVGIKLSELYKDNPDIIRDMHKCFDKKTSLQREMEYTFQTVGKIRQLLASYAYVPQDQVLVHTQDITERKQAEEDKIRQARYIAGGFAHEIRNSLFPAKGALNIIRKPEESEQESTERFEKYRRIADRAVSRAIDTTRLISEFTRMDREHIPEKVSLKKVVEDVLHSNILKLEKRNIEINYNDLPDEWVVSNRRQLYMVFNNLLINSIDALTETADPRIFVTWGRRDDFVEVSFKDNGPGIPKDILNQVFDAFFSTKQDRGTGLGLAITKKIVEMYGGQIKLHSHDGEGAKFTIRFKIA
ncbi:MAG: PAS domain S-box protein [candidate division Zixibacteria bacterium]|nr:PAS domain S-box protein [candidate division Zixibacteria bacterium]